MLGLAQGSGSLSQETNVESSTQYVSASKLGSDVRRSISSCSSITLRLGEGWNFAPNV